MTDAMTPERPPEPTPSPVPSGEPSPDTKGRDARTLADLDIIRTGATILAVLGVVALLYFAASVFIMLFSALLLAFALEPAVHLLCVRTRLRRHHASGIVVFLFVAMIYGTEIAAGIGQGEAWGCVVKDLDQGLGDFLSRRGDDTVFLCWRLGESSIRYWHGLQEGFAGRKPVALDEPE